MLFRSTSENYDSLIGGLLLKQMNGLYYLSYNKDIDINELDKHSDWLTWLKAKSVKWREVNQYLGDSIWIGYNKLDRIRIDMSIYLIDTIREVPVKI